ncbi:MAG: hypothetical protein KF726_05180 [Anaerolineae bacterium]|nr:hypothetical protein [Anaerolineae bacterium]
MADQTEELAVMMHFRRCVTAGATDGRSSLDQLAAGRSWLASPNPSPLQRE